MKRLAFLFLFAFLVLGLANAALTGISVDISKYEPYPAQPGQYIDVWISVQNIGGGSAENVQVRVSPSYPFSIDPNENATKDLGTLIGGQEAVMKFKVRVDQNAVQGNNFLDVQYKYGGFDWITKRMEISVQTHDAILSINRVSTEPDTLVPGKTGSLVFELQNMADSFLSDVKVKLDLSNESMPFVVVNSSSEKWISNIDSGKNETVSFAILTFPNAESKIYKVPFEISYYDSLGTEYTKADTLGIVVGNVPIIEMLLDKTTIKKAGTTGTVTFEIINKGLTSIKFLTVEIEKTDDFDITSPSKLYVGELGSDDTDSFDMSFYIKPNSKSTIDIPVKLQYLDSTNKEYSITENVQLRLYSDSEMSSYNLNNGNSTVVIVAAIAILAIAGWFVYTKWIKKK